MADTDCLSVPFQVALTISGPGWLYNSLAGDDLKAAKAILNGWVAAEKVKRDTAAAKNDLEAYIIKTREALETDEMIMKVSRGTVGCAG